MKAQIVLIPVSVGTPPAEKAGDGPGEVDECPPALLGLSDGAGGWLQAAIEDEPSVALASLLADLPDGYRDILDFNQIRPRPVTFIDQTEHDGGVTLLYSVSLPSAVAELSTTTTDQPHWVPLVWPERSFSAAKMRGPAMISDLPHAHEVLDFWRQSLEETTAVFGFLPQYFTLRQLREVYSAVWGYEQDFNAFKTWALDATFWEERPKTGTLGAYLKDVGTTVPGFDDSTTFTVDADGEVHVTVPGSPDAGERIRERLKIARAAALFAGGGAGATAAAVALPVLAAAGPALAISFVTGAAIHSYLRTTGAAGKKPTWYMRIDERPQVGDKLAKLYSPRPAWLYGGA